MSPFNRQAYATLYFRSLRLQDEHFLTLKRLGLKAEIYFEYGWDRLSASAHRELAARVKGELPGCGLHLPYAGLIPGERDDDGAMAAQMARALETAARYQPDHLVAHAYYDELNHAAGGPRKFLGLKKSDLLGPPHAPAESFLENSQKFWLKVLDASPARLLLENTHEHSPLSIKALLDRLPPRAEMCLDLGHWFYYAMGRHWDNLAQWLALCAARVGHLHLHDNDGESDRHQGLGQGLIDWTMVRKALAEHGLTPSYTLENHRIEALAQSCAFLEANPLF
ncbi:MAG: sugar phosphate isomerase/epimerase [Deltaproteobacteria bacterium]|jgi:sugar phosphate isomerase/epimerase|nr:sugar phosphate isomerase/epimerase [Deltaproteobacteria bacterium]